MIRTRCRSFDVIPISVEGLMATPAWDLTRVVQQKVQQIGPLLKQGRVDEALKLVDEVLEITQ